MCGWHSPLIALVASGWLAAAPAVAGVVRGTVRCSERCAEFVVYLEGVAGRWEGSGQVVELGQKNKLFVPSVLPLLKGSTLRIGNDDPFLHNVHARKEGKTVFNVNLLFQYQTLDLVVTEAGVYEISCEPHPEMWAVIVALENPFFSQPDVAGRFELTAVPPGSYEVVSLDAGRGRRKTKRVRVDEGVVTLKF